MKISFPLLLFFLIHHSLLPAQVNTDSNWAFSVNSFYYIVPADENALSAIGYADYKKFHLETRYNYEDKNTLSLFFGRRFQFGNNWQFTLTPMIGLIVGNTDAVAPALEVDISWHKFGYYSETEYVIDFDANENNFFYVWGELVYRPIESLEFGMSYQKTRLYKSNFDIQRGFMGKYSFWKMNAGLYYFNPFSTSEFFVVSLGIDF